MFSFIENQTQALSVPHYKTETLLRDYTKIKIQENKNKHIRIGQSKQKENSPIYHVF